MELVRVLAGHGAAIARTHRINEDEVAFVQNGIFVVHQAIGRRQRIAIRVHQHPPRPQHTEVQPDGRGARPPVEGKRDGAPRRVVHVVAGVGDEENGRFRLLLIIILQQNRAHRDRVGNFLAVNGDGVLRRDEFFLGERRGFRRAIGLAVFLLVVFGHDELLEKVTIAG